MRLTLLGFRYQIRWTFHGSGLFSRHAGLYHILLPAVVIHPPAMAKRTQSPKVMLGV